MTAPTANKPSGHEGPATLEACIAVIVRAALGRAAQEALQSAVHTREAIDRASAAALVSNLVTVTKSRTAHDIHDAILALADDPAVLASIIQEAG